MIGGWGQKGGAGVCWCCGRKPFRGGGGLDDTDLLIREDAVQDCGVEGRGAGSDPREDAVQDCRVEGSGGRLRSLASVLTSSPCFYQDNSQAFLQRL